jgi:hypothetical protein
VSGSAYVPLFAFDLTMQAGHSSWIIDAASAALLRVFCAFPCCGGKLIRAHLASMN